MLLILNHFGWFDRNRWNIKFLVSNYGFLLSHDIDNMFDTGTSNKYGLKGRKMKKCCSSHDIQIEAD